MMPTREQQTAHSLQESPLERPDSEIDRSNIPQADEESLWKPIDVARFLQVPISWVYESTRKRGNRRLPFFKVGMYLRFDPGEIREFAKKHFGRNCRLN